MSNDSSLKKKRVAASIALLALGAVIVGTAVAFPAKSMTMADSQTTSSANTKAEPTTTTPSSASSVIYKNGNYSAVGNYYSPGGQESVKVSLSLNNDIVTASSVQSGANDPTASSYQSIFIGNYKQFVIGKKITSIKLTNVSGSSLTSQGFQDALKQIEQQAKA